MVVGVKESSKRKMVRSTWAGQVKNVRWKPGKESRCPDSEGETETWKIEIATGVALKVTQKEWKKKGKKPDR